MKVAKTLLIGFLAFALVSIPILSKPGFAAEEKEEAAKVAAEVGAAEGSKKASLLWVLLGGAILGGIIAGIVATVGEAEEAPAHVTPAHH